MDLKLVLALAICCVVAVDAMSSQRGPSRRCQVLCRRGFSAPFCRCRQRSPCFPGRCSRRAVCVVRFGRGLCIPRRPFRRTPRECRYPKKVGRCRAAIPRFFYNNSTRKCERFIFGGCEANPNNFRTLPECQAKCQSGARRSRTRD